MLAPQLVPSAFTAAWQLSFNSRPRRRPVHSLRHMTTQLFRSSTGYPESAILINVVSKRVRQLGLGHRPLVRRPRMSLRILRYRILVPSLDARF